MRQRSEASRSRIGEGCRKELVYITENLETRNILVKVVLAQTALARSRGGSGFLYADSVMGF
jgi:hypothetical protein